MKRHTTELDYPKKAKDEVVGFNVRCLDDGSYILKTDNSDYSKCEEMSFKNTNALMTGIKKVMGELDTDMGTKEEKKEVDELSK